jgi:hypothetical protein
VNEFAKHFRIFNAQPTDDLVEKRIRAVTELTQTFKRKTDASVILQLANDLVDGVVLGALPSSMREQVAKSISKTSPSFVPEGNELEVMVCGLVAALQYIRSAKLVSGVQDLFAGALLSGLKFQVPLGESRLEALRREISDAAAEHLRKRAEDRRERRKVPDVALASSPVGLSAAEVNNALKETVDALRANEGLDREELDLMWWVLADWSELLSAHFSRRADLAGLVAGGLEAAGKLKHLPAEAHFQLILRHAVPGQQSNLHELLDAVSNDLGLLRQELEATAAVASSHRALFPLLTALVDGTSVGPTADVQRSHAEWARRSLLERILVRRALLMQA